MKPTTVEWLSKWGKWGGVMTTNRDGSKVLELHKERKFVLMQHNLKSMREQNDQN